MSCFRRSLIIVFLLSTTASSQVTRISDLKTSLDSLNQKKKAFQDSVNYFQTRIDRLLFLVDSIDSKKMSDDNLIYKIKPSSFLRDTAGYPAKTIYTTNESDKGVVFEILDNNYVKVRVNGVDGFMHYMNFEKSEELKEVILEKNRKNEKINKDLQDKRNEKLESIRNKISLIETDPIWVKSDVANLRVSPTTSSEIVKVLERGEILFRKELKNDWQKVFLRNYDMIKIESFRVKDEESNYLIGWIHSSLLSVEKVGRFTYEEIRRRDFVNKKKSSLTQQNKDDILNGKIRIGMTKLMVLASWGDPVEINRTVTEYSVREQLIFDYPKRTYVYIENGILKSYQD